MAEPHSPVPEEAVARFRTATGKRLAWIAVLALGPTVAFFALFAWDHERDGVGHETSGPYSAWQVVLFVAPIVLTFWFAQDWAQTDDSGLYAVGVGMLAIGSFIGVAVVSALARSFLRANPEPLEPRGSEGA